MTNYEFTLVLFLLQDVHVRTFDEFRISFQSISAFSLSIWAQHPVRKAYGIWQKPKVLLFFSSSLLTRLRVNSRPSKTMCKKPEDYIVVSYTVKLLFAVCENEGGSPSSPSDRPPLLEPFLSPLLNRSTTSLLTDALFCTPGLFFYWSKNRKLTTTNT